MLNYRLIQGDTPRQEDIQFISKRIEECNTAQVGYNDARRLTIFVRDEPEQIAGGLVILRLAGH
jgi:hypothetical protein